METGQLQAHPPVEGATPDPPTSGGEQTSRTSPKVEAKDTDWVVLIAVTKGMPPGVWEQQPGVVSAATRRDAVLAAQKSRPGEAISVVPARSWQPKIERQVQVAAARVEDFDPFGES